MKRLFALVAIAAVVVAGVAEARPRLLRRTLRRAPIARPACAACQQATQRPARLTEPLVHVAAPLPPLAHATTYCPSGQCAQRLGAFTPLPQPTIVIEPADAAPVLSPRGRAPQLE